MKSVPAPVAAFEELAGRKFRKAKSIAEQLGVCPRTVLRWADAGKITRHKINARVVLFDETEVAAFISSARVPTIGETLPPRPLQEMKSGQEVAKQVFDKNQKNT
ncbi:MAG: helix-turn-helix domain-containing protein [Lacunisphaera sp.]